MQKKDNNSVTYHQSYDKFGRLKSVIRYKIPTDEIKGFVFIPKWFTVLAGAFYLLILLILFAAIFIVTLQSRPGFYQESCLGRSCIKNFGLTCKNNTCTCATGYTYVDKCILKKTYLQQCNANYYCQDNTNLVCLSGVCTCNSTQYWDGKVCTSFSEYHQSCKTDTQCDPRLKLYCNTKYGLCDCTSDRAWDGNFCVPKRGYNESCSVIACQLVLSCVNGLCQCNGSQWWNISSCVNRFVENVTCTQSNQCLNPMICSSNNICQCNQTFYYYDATTNSCKPQGSYLATCSISYNCRVDKYLGCSNGRCSCISSYPAWSNGFDKCIVPAIYAGSCFQTSDCETSKFLICSNGTSCWCPSNLIAGKCDCPVRTYGNEMFWDGSTCTIALNNTKSCTNATTNYMCQTLTQGTTCSGLISFSCKCSSTEYFNNADNKCETLLTVNNTCTQADACDSTLGLICRSGLCNCNSTQFWKSSVSGCINFIAYNSGTCAADDQCDTNLVCKLSGSSCSCPNAVSNGKCDCPPRVYGSEYYWNVTYCVPAKAINSTCTSNYECQQLTQLTTCSGGICTCNTNCYFNSSQCVCCPSGYTLHRSSCFMISTTTLGNNCCNGFFCFGSGCSSLQVINSNTLTFFCGNNNKARVAILEETDALFPSFTSVFANDYYFDAYRNVSGSTDFYSYMTKGYYISGGGSNSPYWDLTGPAGENCARFKTGSGSREFKSHVCTDNKNWICEVVI